MNNLHHYMQELGQRARQSAKIIGLASSKQKNAALMAIADAIRKNVQTILSANALDLEAGQKSALSDALLDRLELNSARIEAMCEGLEQVALLPDPVGTIDQLSMRPSGIQLGKMRVPLGVIAIIYESRPNVTIDAAALCLKSGNACILRGGKEAAHSNQAIALCIQQGLEYADLDADIVQVVSRIDRELVKHLVQAKEWVDVVIPRGGKGLIEHIAGQASVPVIKHLDGICHVYIDAIANVEKAISIAFNAKTHRYGVCNAMETLLVHRDIAQHILPNLIDKYQQKGVEVRGCTITQQFVTVEKASVADWSTEYLAPIVSIKVVKDIEEAVEHIALYSSGHTEAIVSEDYSAVRYFMRAVDSASVIANASTRFADGFEYGLGAEIGISTDKFHVRGPVGLEGLTSQKYVVFGDGQIRQ